MVTTKLPELPGRLEDCISYLSKDAEKPIEELFAPFNKYEKVIRELYAQEPGNNLLNDPYINTVPIFAGHEQDLRIHARKLENEDEAQKSKYLMPLNSKYRKANGSPAVVSSLKEFQHNFSIFSEQSLSELDWSNVVAAGSSALTPLLPIPQEHSESKKSIRNYYHNVVATASDVDLFIYGLSEEDALKKIKHIEKAIKDSIMAETTTIRTKNAITIASQHPVRHVQIVLRIYKSVSEILTCFDVDCSCVAYDGKQIHATPRAVAALMTQINKIDLTRRSPSYESRLSKYAQRGFEIYWPELDRTRIDPTIYERSFPRTVGLARLLVLEKLPKDVNRQQYSNLRREERGRPTTYNFNRRALPGNVKDDNVDNVADWQEDDQISNYHSFTIPYGPRFHAKRIEKLLYTKDLLLNAEWNVKDRKVSLHRHPAFFGDAEDVFGDCCGFCPAPETEEEKLMAEEEAKHYISGKIEFITDDPGRQTIGSFNPLDADDWVEMAYVGNTGRICQAIVDQDVDLVNKLLCDGIDVNRRDYTGRTLLHLATMTSSVEVVRCLLQHGAYIVPRIADGQTALHLAAVRGDADIMRALFEKSEENRSAAARKEETREETGGEMRVSMVEQQNKDDDTELIEDVEGEEGSDAASEASAANSDFSAFLKVEGVSEYMKKDSKDQADTNGQEATVDNNTIEPKDDILDINLPAWDTACTPMHLATVFGNIDALKQLLATFAADPGLPVKLMQSYNNSIPRDAILSLVLALSAPEAKAKAAAKELLAAGAKCSQAGIDNVTAFQYFANHSEALLDCLFAWDKQHAKLALNHIAICGSYWQPKYLTPLRTAIENQNLGVLQTLLNRGAEHEVEKDVFVAAIKKQFGNQVRDQHNDNFKRYFLQQVEQPVVIAVDQDFPLGVKALIDAGADPNTLGREGNQVLAGHSTNGNAAKSLLDMVRTKIDELAQYTKSMELAVPEEPEGLDDLFDSVKKNTYEHWAVMRYVQESRKQYDEKLASHERAVKLQERDAPRQRKVKMVQQAMEQFKELETYLVEKGAKTFVALHYSSVINNEEERAAAEYQNRIQSQQQEYSRQQQGKSQKESLHTFDVADLTNVTRAEFMNLFEAAWIGDLGTIQNLTMTFHGEDDSRPPLKIATNDRFKHNPFDIALLRGHVDVALVMLDIAQAQYQPKDDKLSYTIPSDDESDCSEDDDRHNSRTIRLASHLPASMRNRFTVEDIGEVAQTVKGKVSPVDMLKGFLPLRSYVEIGNLHIDTLAKQFGDVDLQSSFFGFAMYKNDLGLFKRLVDVALKYQKSLVDAAKSGSENQFNIWTDVDFETALRLGKPEFLEIMITRTGAGISFDHLIKKEGIEAPDRLRYYKGLSIRGKKNTAWAQSYRHDWTPSSLSEPLLLRACYEGHLKSVEWLLSDAPLRCYLTFADANKEHAGINALAQAKGGLKQTISDWLGTRQELAIACAILSKYRRGKTETLVSYLVEALPQYVNASSDDGRTALQLAVAYRQPSLVKILVDAGSNVEATDKKGNNIMHVLLTIWRNNQFGGRTAPFDLADMRETLAVLDKSTLKKLLLRRNAYGIGAKTPLQQWLSLHGDHHHSSAQMHKNCGRSNDGCCATGILRMILELSNGEDLSMIDGSGDTAVHHVAKMSRSEYLRVMLEADPRCILRENAVGRTPAEIARDVWLKGQVSAPPSLGAGIAFYQQPEHAKPLVQRDLEWFNDDGKHQGSQRTRTLEAQTWDVCRQHLRQNKDVKRKLVSLAEANEVAKRLAKRNRPNMDEKGQYDFNMNPLQARDEINYFFRDPSDSEYDLFNRKNDRIYDNTCPPIPYTSQYVS